MKFCKFCGKQLDNEANFCPYCMQKQNATSTPAEPGAKKMSPVLIAAIALGAAAVLAVGGFFVFKLFILKPKNSSPASSKSGNSSISESSDVLWGANGSSFPEGVSGGYDNDGSVSGSGEGAQGENSAASGSEATPAGGSANGSVGGSTGGSTGGSAGGYANGSAGTAAGSTGGSYGGSSNTAAGSSSTGSSGGSQSSNSCASGHHWSDATCTSPATCSVCGKTSGQPLGHNIFMTKCQRCGQTDYSKIAGTYNNVGGFFDGPSGYSEDIGISSFTISNSGVISFNVKGANYSFKIVETGNYLQESTFECYSTKGNKETDVTARANFIRSGSLLVFHLDWEYFNGQDLYFHGEKNT